MKTDRTGNFVNNPTFEEPKVKANSKEMRVKIGRPNCKAISLRSTPNKVDLNFVKPVLEHTVVLVLEVVDSEWSKISTEGVEGFVNSEFLTEV